MGLKQIAEFQRPEVRITGLIQQLVNFPLPLVGASIGQKLADFVRRRQEARHIQPHAAEEGGVVSQVGSGDFEPAELGEDVVIDEIFRDRKSTRLNSSHLVISYAVFCLKKKKHKSGE